MSSRQRMSETLAILSTPAEQSVCCQACGHRLGPAGVPWKSKALLDEAPVEKEAGPLHVTEGDVVLRRFLCPGCGVLLDTETALRSDPFLNDVLFP